MRFLVLIPAHQGVWSFKCFITTLYCCGCLNDGAGEGAFLVRFSLYLGLDALLSYLIISLLLQRLGPWLQENQGSSSASVPRGKGQGGTRTRKGFASPAQATKRAQGQLGQFGALAHAPSSVNYLQLVDTGKAEVIPIISWLQSCHLASCLCAGVPCDVHVTPQQKPNFYTHPTLIRKRKNNTLTL